MTKFYTEISQFEPLMPSNTGQLENVALELTQLSAGLATNLHPITLDGIRELLRIINSYYSNLIEGNNTHPIEVERAMQSDYSNEPAKRDRQLESLIHITVTELDFSSPARNRAAAEEIRLGPRNAHPMQITSSGYNILRNNCGETMCRVSERLRLPSNDSIAPWTHQRYINEQLRPYIRHQYTSGPSQFFQRTGPQPNPVPRPTPLQ